MSLLMSPMAAPKYALLSRNTVSGRMASDGVKEQTRVELAADSRRLRVVVVERSYAIDLACSHWEEGAGLCSGE